MRQCAPRWLFYAALLLGPVASLAAQGLPKDITRKVDTFTSDTIYTTKYGRLDQPNGCGRDDLAIEWRMTDGSRGRVEWLHYEWYHSIGWLGQPARWLNGQDAYLNLDGELLGLTRVKWSPRLTTLSQSVKQEVGAFELPPGTLARIATSKHAKLRIKGPDLTCDGTIEPKMITRLQALIAAAPTPNP